MTRKLFLIAFIAIGLMFNCYASDALKKGELTKPSENVQKLIDKHKLEVVDLKYVKNAIGNGTRKGSKALLIDARPNLKYKKGTIPSSINIPDTQFEEFYPQVSHIDKNREVIVFCGGWKCGKSPKAAAMLIKKGFKNVKLYQAGEPEWAKQSYNEIDTVVVKAAQDKNNTFLIDARPYKKYLQATIPGSISIPDTSMNKLLGKFPADKNMKIITFCGGYDCGKSHKVAKKLQEMGYKNVSVYAGGMPQWKKEGLRTTSSSANVSTSVAKVEKSNMDGIKKGADEGSVDGEWFKKLIVTKTMPENIHLVDVVPTENFKNGHLPNAVNIYAESMSADVLFKQLPKNKVTVFNCASGARALEAWMKLKDNKFDVSNVYYFDANINCNKNFECKIEVNEPLN